MAEKQAQKKEIDEYVLSIKVDLQMDLEKIFNSIKYLKETKEDK